MTSRLIHKDRVLGLLLLIITAFFGYMTNVLPQSYVEGDPGPRLFPNIGCFILGLVGISLLCKKREDKKEFLSKQEQKRLIKLFSLYVLFWVMLWLFGYLAAIPVVTFLVSVLFSREAGVKLWKILVYTVLVTVGIYFAYVVALGSSLPKGIFWRLF